MRRHRRSLRLLSILLGFTLLAAACGDDDDGETAGEGTTTTAAPEEEEAETAEFSLPSSCEGGAGEAVGEPIALEAPEGAGGDFVDLQNFAQGNPDHIDPALAGVVQGAQVTNLLFDGLTESNVETAEIEPNVAESWESNEDATVWTFQLREGVTFSNGDPVLPSNFKCGWERAAQPGLASEISYHFDPIDGKTAVDDGSSTELSGVVADDEALTLEVTLAEPFADFPAAVSHSVFSPVPRDEIAGLDDQTQWERGVMTGNGPFIMSEEWVDDQYIRLERNESYWGGPRDHLAYVDTLEFRISADVDSAYNDFQAGTGQTGLIPPGRFAEATEQYPNSTGPQLISYHFFVNQEDETLGGDENLKLRQAISTAIDRDAINTAVYDDARQNSTGITPPGIPGQQPDLCEFCTYDQARAQQLFDEWKAETGTDTVEPITINFNADSGHEPVVQILQENLRAIGIESTLDPHDPEAYFSEMRGGDCALCRAGWQWDYAVLHSGLYPMFHSASIDGDNLARYSDPEFDAMVDQARSTLDEVQRQQLYIEAERLMLADLPVIPINWYTGQIVYTEDVQNFVQTPLGFVAYEELQLG